MTLEERIEQEKFKARVDRIKANRRIFHNNDEDEISACNRSAEEHEQLVELLEELKSYRENSNGYTKEDIELNRKAMYNKAIDDFVNACKEDISCQTFGLHIKGIERIAEQLKVGGTE